MGESEIERASERARERESAREREGIGKKMQERDTHAYILAGTSVSLHIQAHTEYTNR